MSKLFNQSRKPVRNRNAEDATEDVQERISGLAASDGFNNPRLRAVLATLEESPKGVPSNIPAPVEEYGRFNLPQNQEKSLLVSQYSVSLQHAMEAYRSLRTKLVKHQDQTGARSIVMSSAGQGE